MAEQVGDVVSPSLLRLQGTDSAFSGSSIDFDLGMAEWTDSEDSYLTAVVPSHVDFDHWLAHDFSPVPSDVDFYCCFADDLVPSDFDVDC